MLLLADAATSAYRSRRGVEHQVLNVHHVNQSSCIIARSRVDVPRKSSEKKASVSPVDACGQLLFSGHQAIYVVGRLTGPLGCLAGCE